MVNLNETVFQLERDKNKVDQRLKYFQNTREEDSKGTNNELSKTIQQETDNLKELSKNFEKKINEKREVLRNLESDMKSIELNERKKYDIFNQNELKIKQLEYQLNENVEETRRNNFNSKNNHGRENIFISHNYSLEDSYSNENNNNCNKLEYNINSIGKKQFQNNKYNYNNSEYSTLSGGRLELTNYDSIIETKNQTNFLSQNDNYFNNKNSARSISNFSKKF